MHLIQSFFVLVPHGKCLGVKMSIYDLKIMLVSVGYIYVKRFTLIFPDWPHNLIWSLNFARLKKTPHQLNHISLQGLK